MKKEFRRLKVIDNRDDVWKHKEHDTVTHTMYSRIKIDTVNMQNSNKTWRWLAIKDKTEKEDFRKMEQDHNEHKGMWKIFINQGLRVNQKEHYHNQTQEGRIDVIQSLKKCQWVTW